MKTNFDINLPTIPGKMIKFKIQDIKNKAFGTQVARFKDNKALLTKKFIQSFSNFHQSTKNQYNNEDDIQTQAQSYLSQNRQPMSDTPMKFHLIIPQEKKHLINLQQKIKRQLQADQRQQIQKLQKSYLSQKGQSILKSEFKGFTFNKAGSQSNIQNQSDYQNYQQGQYQLTDNYYFTKDYKLESQKDKKKNKKERPNAIFKAQSRTRIWQRDIKSIVPGPGSYLKNISNKKQNIKNNNKRSLTLSQRKQSKPQQEKQMNYRRFKQIISKVMNQRNTNQDQNNIQKQLEQQKHFKNQHMFIIDDRDRFGQQLYPIAPKLKVPGPGSYNGMPETIQSKAKKVQVVQQQRKLLKQWFNS